MKFSSLFTAACVAGLLDAASAASSEHSKHSKSHEATKTHTNAETSAASTVASDATSTVPASWVTITRTDDSKHATTRDFEVAADTPAITTITATSKGETAMETFRATSMSDFSALAETLTTALKDGNGDNIDMIIFPGGLAWVPFGEPPAFAIAPPTEPPPPPPAATSTGPAVNAATVTTIKTVSAFPTNQPTACKFLGKRSDNDEVEFLNKETKRDPVNNLVKRIEYDAIAKYPLIAAIEAIGGMRIIEDADDLQLVTTRFPSSQRYRYVTGLEGRVSVNIDLAATDVYPAVRMRRGDLFRIRWDFDDGPKGVHINAEFFGTGRGETVKIAFRPRDPPLSRGSSTQYDQVVKNQSHSIGYSTQPNSRSTTYHPEERTGERLSSGSDPEKYQRRALRHMAYALADMWARQVGC